MAEIGIEERKRGAPWVLIMILLVVAAVIGWWLWSTRAPGEPTTTPATPGDSVVTATPPTTQ